MDLTPWRVVLLIAAAAIFAAVAILDIASPASQGPCARAENSEANHLLGHAEHAYAQILAQEPSRKCALHGMKEVGRAWCARAKELAEGSATLEAVKVYTRVLRQEPLQPEARKCALTGLGEVNSTTTAANCPNALKVACNVTVVNVNGVDGRNGLNGRNGRNGRDGINGANGRNGRNGRNGNAGSASKNGVNGRNGLNGRAGRNGLNGRNGRNGTDWHHHRYERDHEPSTSCGSTGCS